MSEYYKPIVKILMLKGKDGDGKGISSVSKTSTSGLVDTYTITLTDGTKSTFTVTNGKEISSIDKTGTSGLVDTYTITFNDGTNSSFTVTNGKGISNISKTETSGLVDTYTIEFNDGTTSTFTVTNGDSSYKPAVEALGKRIDNLILSSGTESSAEVIDARNGYDGTTYDTLGTAIRTQVSELNSDLSRLSEEVANKSGGQPTIAEFASDMTDTTNIYLYVGREEGYTNGDWYYYTGTSWLSGGKYGECVSVTDITSGLSDIITDRNLIWHDEFDGDQLDSAKWDNFYGYTSSKRNYLYKDVSKNVSVYGGILDYYALKDYPSDICDYSAPFIHTNNKFEFRYGLIEARIKFSQNDIYHSTFWTLGANTEDISIDEGQSGDSSKGVLFPSCGEIDIAECDNRIVSAVCHYGNGWDDDTYYSKGAVNLIEDGSADFHIYGCEWTETEIIFYVDRVEKGRWNHSECEINGWNPFKHPHYLIFNCIPTVGNAPTWDQMHTLVDWIRVYAPVGKENTKETGITIPAEIDVFVGEKIAIEYIFAPEYVSDMTLKWESYNESICTCYGGKVVGVNTGTTYVKCTTKNGFTALCKVTVRNTNYTVTNNLTNATTSNSASNAESGSAYSATITAESGYVLSSINITMGGTDITNSSYNNGAISIEKVTGDIVITATASSAGINTDAGWSDGTANTSIFHTVDYIPVVLTEDKLTLDIPDDLPYLFCVYTYGKTYEKIESINYTKYNSSVGHVSGWAYGDGFYTGLTNWSSIAYLKINFKEKNNADLTGTTTEQFDITINGTTFRINACNF